MALLAGEGVGLGRHHVGDRPGHFGGDETILAAEFSASGLLSCCQRLVPVEVGPVSAVVIAEGVRDQQGVAGRVIGLFAAEHLDRPDLGFAVVGAALEAVDADDFARVQFGFAQGVVHAAVEPDVLGDDVGFVLEVAFLAVVGVMSAAVFQLERLAVLVQLAGGGPVPAHLGGNAAARELGDVAGLAGELVGVIVQFGHRRRVRPGAVAGLAGGRVDFLLAAHVGARFLVRGGGRVAAARHVMAGGGVASAAGEVEAVLGHVYVQILGRHLERAVDIAVFHRIAATAIEVAGAASGAAGLADVAGDFTQVRCLHDLAGMGREFGVLVRRVASQPRQLAVGAGGVVADQTVHIVLGGEVEFLVLPAVADVAGGAELIVRRHGGAEVVDDVLFAQALFGVRVHELPGPVLGFLHLFGGLGVAGETGLGDFRAAGEGLFQGVELAVVGGGVGGRLGGGLNRGHRWRGGCWSGRGHRAGLARAGKQGQSSQRQGAEKVAEGHG